MRASVAIVVAVFAVLGAIVVGITAGRIARPSPTPILLSRTFTPAPTPTPAPVDEATLFREPLSGGCATAHSLWVVTNGGGILRYDGTAWTKVDNTLRSLVRVRCTAESAYAVGLVGSFVIMDERARQIRSIDLAQADFHGVSPVDDGAVMVGTQGLVFYLNGGTVQQDPEVIDEDLYDVVAFGLRSAWAVGQAGITYRLDQRGWNPVGSGQTKSLRAVAAVGPGTPIAVGDGGVIVRYDAGWHEVTSGVDADLHAIILDPAIWIAGSAGTLLTGTALGSLHPVDLKTTCDLVAVFPSSGDIAAGDVFVIGNAGPSGAVWRLHDGAVAQHWGGC